MKRIVKSIDKDDVRCNNLDLEEFTRIVIETVMMELDGRGTKVKPTKRRK